VTRCDQILWLCVHRRPTRISQIGAALGLCLPYVSRRIALLRVRGLLESDPPRSKEPTPAGVERITQLERHLRAAGQWVDVPSW